MDCDEARDLLLEPGRRLQPDLTHHLRGCPACAAAAERDVRLDRMVAPLTITAPPAEVAGRALAAALAELAALPRVAVATYRPAHSRPAEQPSLAAYVLAGVLLATAAGVLGLGPFAALQVAVGDLLQPLTWVLTSPAIWLLPPPDRVAAALSPWFATVVLAWALRPRLTTRERRPG